MEYCIFVLHHSCVLFTVAVVVVNTENNIFIMAGMKEDEKDPSSPDPAIPTVMVTSKDGAMLARFLETARATKAKPQLSVQVTQFPVSLANEIMGLDEYPSVSSLDELNLFCFCHSWLLVEQVWLQKYTLLIKPAGKWSLFLSSSADQPDWRITLVPRIVSAICLFQQLLHLIACYFQNSVDDMRSSSPHRLPAKRASCR